MCNRDSETQENTSRLIRKLGNDLDFMKRVYTERRNEYRWWEDTLCFHFQDTTVRLPVKGGQWTRVPTHKENYNHHSREEAWRDIQHRQVCKLLESGTNTHKCLWVCPSVFAYSREPICVSVYGFGQVGWMFAIKNLLRLTWSLFAVRCVISAGSVVLKTIPLKS